MTALDGAETLEELAAMVRGELNAACVLVTRTTKDSQQVLAHAGRTMPDWFMQSSTLDYSICQHSAAMDFPLIIDNALSHPLMHGNLAVEQLGIASYIGAPVHFGNQSATGAICGLEFHQRRWTEDDVSCIILAARMADRIFNASA